MKKYIFSAACSLLLYFSPATAQKTNPPPPAPVKVTSVEGITEYRLANGLRVLIFPDPSIGSMTVNMTYLVGSRMEGYGETGMAHLLEHMLFKGSSGHTNIPQELTSHGASPNGSTWYDRTNYYETFSASEANLNWALSLESDRMTHSFIAAKDLASEFSVVRNEFEMGENDPSSILMERVMSTAFLWHNYGKSTIGSREDIEKVPVENLKLFYQKYYQPDNAVLTVAGKIDEKKVLQLVSKYFGSIPRPARKLQEPYTVEPVQDGERLAVLRRVGDVQVASAGYHIPSGSHPDFAAVDVLNEVLTNTPSGRLYKALVETKLATAVSGYAYSLKDPGFAYYSANVLSANSLETAQKVLLTTLDDLRTTPVTEEETERAKQNLLKNYELVYNNSETIGTLLSEFIALGDWRLLFIYRDNVTKIKAEEVTRVARAYYKPSNRTLGLFYPEKVTDRAVIPPSPDLNAMLKGYTGQATLAAAAAFDPAPSNIDALTKNGSIPGGAKYRILQKSTRGSTIKMKITLRIGTEASLKNKSAALNLTPDMLMRGTKSKTFEQINDALAKLKSEVSVFGGEQDVVISVETKKESLKDVLALLREILREPSFPDAEFDKLKQSTLADIDAQKSEPQALAFLKVSQLSNNYPKEDFRYAASFDEKAEWIKKTTNSDLKKLYTDFYNSTNATAAAIGDFDEKVLLEGLNSILANWTSTEAYSRAATVYFDAPAQDLKINTPDKTNAMLAAAENLQLRSDDSDYPALVMGNFILGGGFLNSRLATRIRQKEGISYGVGSWLTAGDLDADGSFGSYAIYNPDNSSKLMAAYRDELDKMVKNGFTEAELKDAKSGFLQSRMKNRSDDDYLLDKLSNYLYLNRNMQWDADFDKKVEALTPVQIASAMRKWVKPEKIIFVQAGEFEKKN